MNSLNNPGAGTAKQDAPAIRSEPDAGGATKPRETGRVMPEITGIANQLQASTGEGSRSVELLFGFTGRTTGAGAMIQLSG